MQIFYCVSSLASLVSNLFLPRLFDFFHFHPIINLNFLGSSMVERVAVEQMNHKGDTRTYADRRQYLIEAVRKRRRKIRQMAVEYKGGKCEICGYARCSEALEFHHKEDVNKEFGISEKGYTRSWAMVRQELDKCVMLCANCHREVHAGLQLLQVTAVEKSGEFKEA